VSPPEPNEQRCAELIELGRRAIAQGVRVFIGLPEGEYTDDEVRTAQDSLLNEGWDLVWFHIGGKLVCGHWEQKPRVYPFGSVEEL
jgi:hypothetical protein